MFPGRRKASEKRGRRICRGPYGKRRRRKKEQENTCICCTPGKGEDRAARNKGKSERVEKKEKRRKCYTSLNDKKTRIIFHMSCRHPMSYWFYRNGA
jgi:hypothetical protein